MAKQRKSWLGLATTLMVLGAFACASPPEPTIEENTEVSEEADLEAIRSLVGQVVQAYNEADPDLMCGLYTEDGMRLPPNAGVLEGYQRICDNLQANFATYSREVTMRQEEARFSGDLAVVRGTWALSQTLLSTGETSSDVGTWFHVLERQPDGGWKISRSIWNSDQPLEG